jgi:hypothetical protein
VIGAAVAGDAARTLGEEATIDARTFAKVLVDLEGGRDRLDERTVLLIDEAGTLGAAQAKALFERASSHAHSTCCVRRAPFASTARTGRRARRSCGRGPGRPAPEEKRLRAAALELQQRQQKIDRGHGRSR